MQIAGFVKNSFVDYPNQISSVVFTLGCPLNCYYCHNKHIIKQQDQILLPESQIFDFLGRRKGLVDAVVISGGEPTVQADLIEFITKIKKLGYLVKLDTNGINPHILEQLFERQLLDYVAMDLKCSLEDYSKVCGTKVNTQNIQKSVDSIIQSGIDYEFRTTLIPEITADEFEKMLKTIIGAKNYYLQKCNFSDSAVLPFFNARANAEKFQNMSKNVVQNCLLRGFD